MTNKYLAPEDQGIAIQLFEGPDAIKKTAHEWEALVGDSFSAIYSGPSWYLAWCDAFRPRRVVVVAARRGGRLIGVLPLARTRTDARGLYFTQVAPFALGDYQPPIVDAEFASAALPMMLDAAFERLGRYGGFWWPHLPTTDPSLDLLRAYLTARGMPFTEDREVAPRANVAGLDFAGAEQMWSPNHRQDVRRKRRRLAETGPVTLWQPSTIEEAGPVLDEFFAVHDRAWLARGYPARFRDPLARRHYHALVRRLWGQGLHFSTVRCGSVDVSYHFGFVSGGWLHWYCPTYRAEFSRYSPSKIHVAMLIEQICRSHWKGLDFLLGDEPYKMPWSNELGEVVSIHAGFHTWAPSYAWFARGKPYVRKRLYLAYFKLKAALQKFRLDR